MEWVRRQPPTERPPQPPGRERRPRGRLSARRRRSITLSILGLAAAAGLAVAVHALVGGRPPAPGASPSTPAFPPALYSPAQPPPAWTGPLPYPLLIADRGQHRLVEVSPAGKVLWSDPASGSAPVPAGAVSFAPDGRSVVATGTASAVVERIAFPGRTVLWHFGQAGHPGAGATQLSGPATAYLLADGQTVVADVGNCRELLLGASGAVAATWGRPQSGFCQTNPAQGLFGYPNGDQPQPGGDILMTFGSGDRIALLSASGAVVWDRAAPTLFGGVASDAQMASGGDVLVTGQGNPGSVVLWNPKTGATVWQYHATTGAGLLDNPTMALQLPGGNIAVADTGNNRVVVIDPHTNRVVWSYGGAGQPGALGGPTTIAVDLWHNWQPQGKG